ncbi:hypothetical protein HHI36_017784 [Cryptolaemus montrouzieri]|uniref:Uncharacterized protein n=1 Tax=Cryptolaemus montrouzieri TaxID=559131 RepID=A0ABD2NP08_9CUCU
MGQELLLSLMWKFVEDAPSRLQIHRICSRREISTGRTKVGQILSGAQVVNLTGVSGVLEIPHSLHVKDPEDVVVPKGQPATLRCIVKALPPGVAPRFQPIVTWLHNDVPIPKNDSKRTVQKDGSLYIPRVTGGRRPLTGAYRCSVKNEVGVVVSGESKLQIASLDVDVSEISISVAEYQPVLLPCHAHSVPDAKFRWDYDKRILPHDLRYVPLPSGALLIFKTASTDAGIYRCTVTNSILRRPKIKTVKLSVLPPFTENKSVSFLPLPFSPNSTVTLGVRTSLYCVASGWPLPVVQWLKDGVVVANLSVLNITNANQASSGGYTCRAYNSLNVVTQDYHLRVQQKPYFTVTPRSKSYTSAGMVRLECQARGYPEPCIQWLKNGQKLKLGARVKKKDGALVMSHTFTYDAGIYQCVATNSAGSIWTSAQVVLTSPNPPPPPGDVRCRSYDDRSVCVTWRSPKNLNASAFSIYSFSRSNYGCLEEQCQGTNNYTGCDDGSQEELGPDYVATNASYYLATGLNRSTNYTFYVRLYSTAASDDSNKASCSTGVKGERNLKFKLLGPNTIELKWSEISSDVPCGNNSTTYIVQWQKEKHQLVNTSYTKNLKYNISGLNPSVLYHFRVMSSSHRDENTPWVALNLPQSVEDDPGDRNYTNFNNVTISQNAPTNPDDFRVSKVSAKSVTLNWLAPNQHPKFYVICYVEIDEEEMEPKKCEDGRILKSPSNMKQIDDLKPNTLYEFRIRAHNSEGYYGPFSTPIEVRTHPDVPSTVLDLKYSIVNESTACLAWLPPLYTSGKLVNYVVTYTPDPNWPLEKWTCITIPADRKSNSSCWLDNKGNTVSVMLVNLKRSEEYTVIVRAGSDVGLSNPTFPFLLKTVNKKRVTDHRTDNQEDIADKQKMGVVLGCVLALVCIVCCISCIVLRRRCIKRRNLAHARLAASNNYYPAVAHYASQGSSVQVRLENTCAADLHEIQSLVTEEVTEIPPAMVHLDSKGRDTIPNGHINGLKKPSMNGHAFNGHVHITENPQFERKEKNGDLHHINYKKSPHYTLFQDDPNSNRIQSPKHHKHHFLDLSPKKRHRCSPHYDNNGLFNGSLDDDTFSFSKDLDLETTQMTCLDDAFIVGNHRRISPLLGPNG